MRLSWTVSGVICLSSLSCSEPANPRHGRGSLPSDAGHDTGQEPTCEAAATCTAAYCPGARKLLLGNQRCALMCDRTVRCTKPLELASSFTGAEPLDPLDLADVRDVVGGAYHRCALLGDGSVRCWGDNRFRVLPDPSLDSGAHYGPAEVPEIDDAVSISSRDAFYQFDWTCVLRANASVVCWGAGFDGPTELSELHGARAMSVADHAVAALFGDDELRIYRLGGDVQSRRLPWRIDELVTGWYRLCVAGAGSVRCGSTMSPFEAIDVPFRPRRLAHDWNDVHAIADDGRVFSHVGEQWSVVPELAGVTSLATNASTLGGNERLCGLFADGRAACKTARAE